MTLTLTIRNFDRLDNGMPTEFVLHRRGALIGRSPTCDWSLPDPRNYISSRHGEIQFADGFYTFVDISMNGTQLNGATDRMAEPRQIENGDMFTLGQYEVVATLTGSAIAAQEQQAEAAVAAQQSNWTGWDSHAPAAAPPAAPSSGGWDGPPPSPPSGRGWDSPAPASASGGWQPQVGPSLARPDAHRSGSFGAPAPESLPAASGGWAPSANIPLPVASTWEPHVEKVQPASGWSSAAPDRPAAPSPDDIWGRIADGNVVDWARGGFGQPIEENRDPLGLQKAHPNEALQKPTPQMAQFGKNDSWGAEPEAAAPTSPAPEPAASRTALPVPNPAPPPPSAAQIPSASAQGVPPSALVGAFVAATGVPADQLKDLSPATLDRAGQLFRKLVAGLVVMIEARARAKSQMGAESTSFSFDGNNPIKFARTPEEAIAALLNPQGRGFMEAGRAIEDAYFDLQSHQIATLKAMQGALRATLDRFSPTAIKKRAETGGFLSKILPGARDAALWQAYEREFGGVAQGSDEAFMDVFAKEFRRAYEEQANSQRKR